MIQEIIVVEGKDDMAAVKAGLDCECIITHGYGFGDDLLDKLEALQERRGLIVLTDPDYAGKRIRERIRDRIPGAKMAFIPRKDAYRGDDIGVENAGPEAIKKAIETARPSYMDRRQAFNMADMLEYGLEACPGAKNRRIRLGEILSIGYGNAKQLLSRLNDYGIEREEFERAMEEINDSE